MTFDVFRLDHSLATGVRDMGFEVPTPIQVRTIPVALRGRDVLGIAETGTGKTAAFALPILQLLLSRPRGGPRALVLAPTRELALQIHREIERLAVHTKIRSVPVYGGVSKGSQIAAFRRGVEIVVACPGRLLDHLRAGAVDLSEIEFLVLDEADRMCDMGFLPDIRRIIGRLPAKRQTLFLSATMPSDIRALARQILKQPETVQIGKMAPVETVSHALYPIPEMRKSELVTSMIQGTSTGRVLVFTRTKARARRLASQLRKRGLRVTDLQGDLTQNRRQRALDGFRNGRYDVLVATDIAARGIDVTGISHVINYDMPATVDAYTHRIGRTGRALRTGEAFTLASRGDGILVRGIEKRLGTSIERRRLPGFDYGEFVPERQFPQGSSRVTPSVRPRGRLRHSGRRVVSSRPARATAR